MAQLITNAQKAKIFAVCNELGIDNDLLHELIFAVTGCHSLRNLTMAQGIMIIDRLEGKSAPAGMATYRQKCFIEALAKEIGWTEENGTVSMVRLEGFLKARFAVNSYKWLTVKKASEVIEALKDMKSRQKS
ncbi:MAG: phage protein GemA/Gp16 family protein [Acetatifactor sp.]